VLSGARLDYHAQHAAAIQASAYEPRRRAIRVKTPSTMSSLAPFVLVSGGAFRVEGVLKPIQLCIAYRASADEGQSVRGLRSPQVIANGRRRSIRRRARRRRRARLHPAPWPAVRRRRRHAGRVVAPGATVAARNLVTSSGFLGARHRPTALPPTRPTQNLKSRRVLEPLYKKCQHPGLAHYIIHS
jgi:hypothetical protein